MKHLLKDSFQYVSFDDFRNRQLFADDPVRFMKTWPGQMKTLKKYAGQASNTRLMYQGETYSSVDGIQVINYKDFLLD